MDINLAYDPDIMEYDISLTAAGDIATGNDLKTAVLTSIFTWARAKADDFIPEDEPAYGWWGENLTEPEDALTGSRLWLLSRAKQTAKLAETAADSAREALAWLKDEGIASDIEVTPENSAGRITLEVVITRYGGERETLRYSDLWRTVGG
jgi:phage gp46-like protein